MIFLNVREIFVPSLKICINFFNGNNTLVTINLPSFFRFKSHYENKFLFFYHTTDFFLKKTPIKVIIIFDVQNLLISRGSLKDAFCNKKTG